MPRKRLFALFMCNMIIYIVGNSLMSLLPIYISNDLGAGTGFAGITFSIAFAVLVISTSMSATISRRLKRNRDIIMICAMICVPALWLSGKTDNPILLTLLLSVEWFFGGLIIAITQIIVATSTRPEQRGRIFGVLMTAGPLSSIISGVTAGAIVTAGGFELLFIFCSVLYIIPVFISRLLVDTKSGAPRIQETQKGSQSMPVILMIIIAASILAHVASFMISVARPIAMDALHFDANAVTSTMTISGLASLALPLVAGWLSDRTSRYLVFLGTYILAAIGTVFYLSADALWQFWIAQAFVSVLGASMAVGSALVTDRVASRNADTSVARFGATPWIGAVIGSTGSGFLMQQVGITITFAIASGLMLLAILIVISIRIRQKIVLLRHVPA